VHTEWNPFSPEHGGSICLSAASNQIARLYCAYVAASSADESAFLGDMVMEADFIPDHAGQFGFFIRQSARRSMGCYQICMERDPKDKAFIRFGLNQPGYEPALQMFPTDFTVENGEVYRLRLDHPQRRRASPAVCDARLEIFREGGGDQPAAAGALRLNLSADNLPDTGQAGIYALHGIPYEMTGKPWRVFVRNFSIRDPVTLGPQH